MHLDFRTVPHLSSAFPAGDSNPLLKTHPITAVPLGRFRAILSESVDVVLSEGRRLDCRTLPHLSDALSEEGKNPILETNHVTAAPL